MTPCRKFAGRAALVTGAGSGIGRASAENLSVAGAMVAVLDINPELADAAAANIIANGGIAIPISADIGVEERVSWAVEEVIRRFGKLDILVNAAASFIQEGVDASAETWRNVLGINVIGTALCCRYASSEMRKQASGSIVNVASTSGLVGHANYATYGSGKAALINLTQCLAVDLGPYNIRVNCVSPGATDTPALWAAVTRAGLSFADFKNKLFSQQCLSKLCSPQEVAAVISFLASDEAEAVTGINLVVDRGLLTKR